VKPLAYSSVFRIGSRLLSAKSLHGTPQQPIPGPYISFEVLQLGDLLFENGLAGEMTTSNTWPLNVESGASFPSKRPANSRTKSCCRFPQLRVAGAGVKQGDTLRQDS